MVDDEAFVGVHCRALPQHAFEKLEHNGLVDRPLILEPPQQPFAFREKGNAAAQITGQSHLLAFAFQAATAARQGDMPRIGIGSMSLRLLSPNTMTLGTRSVHVLLHQLQDLAVKLNDRRGVVSARMEEKPPKHGVDGQGREREKHRRGRQGCGHSKIENHDELPGNLHGVCELLPVLGEFRVESCDGLEMESLVLEQAKKISLRSIGVQRPTHLLHRRSHCRAREQECSRGKRAESRLEKPEAAGAKAGRSPLSSTWSVTEPLKGTVRR